MRVNRVATNVQLVKQVTLIANLVRLLFLQEYRYQTVSVLHRITMIPVLLIAKIVILLV